MAPARNSRQKPSPATESMRMRSPTLPIVAVAILLPASAASGLEVKLKKNERIVEVRKLENFQIASTAAQQDDQENLSRLFIFRKADNPPHQVLDLSSVEAETEGFAPSARSRIIGVDCNFDGAEDFLIQDTVYSSNEFALCFTYDQKSGKFSRSDILGHNLDFDRKNKIIHEEIQKPGGYRYQASYKVVNNAQARISAYCYGISEEGDDEEIDCKSGEKIQEQTAQFIPEGFSVLHETTGDLNLDAYPDRILALKRDDEPDSVQGTEGADTPIRPLLVLTGEPDGTYRLAARNDEALARLSSGQSYDYLKDIVIKRGFFSIEQQGPMGGNLPTLWRRIVTFRYAKPDDRWFLHKDGAETVDVDTGKTTAVKIYTRQDFGELPFERFNHAHRPWWNHSW
jgi:hypothetical protein